MNIEKKRDIIHKNNNARTTFFRSVLFCLSYTGNIICYSDHLQEVPFSIRSTNKCQMCLAVINWNESVNTKITNINENTNTLNTK